MIVTNCDKDCMYGYVSSFICPKEIEPQLNFPVTLYCFEYRSATILLENNKPTLSYSLMTFQAFLYTYTYLHVD